MSKQIKTEHAGAKKRQGYWGRKKEAKSISRKKRRAYGKKAISSPYTDEKFDLGETTIDFSSGVITKGLSKTMKLPPMDVSATSPFNIRPISRQDRNWIISFLTKHWGSIKVVTRGKVYDAGRMPGFVAEKNGKPVGLITYRLDRESCEVMTMNSLLEGTGVGSALLDAVKNVAQTSHCKRLCTKFSLVKLISKRQHNFMNYHRAPLKTQIKSFSVIPAKAGIHIFQVLLDSRLRGNDTSEEFLEMPHNHITIEPGMRGGKPCIRGLRITVYEVLDYLASGMSAEQILEDFPDLNADDIKACLAFAADRERKLLSA